MVQTQIARDTRLIRTQNVLDSEVDGEVIALDVERGQCYGLNAAGSSIWRLLEAETSPARICEALAEEFDVEQADCESDVLALLADLHAEGLIAIRSN